MSALGQKRTSANKLRNLFFMGRATNPSTLRQWPCRDWAGDRRGLHGKMPSRPLAGERGRAFKAISPGMLPPLGIIFGLFVAFIGRFIHGNEVSPGNLCREPAAVA